MPTHLLIEFDGIVYDELWKNFGDGACFDMMNLTEEIINQRRCRKLQNCQEIAASGIIRQCGFMSRNEIYSYLCDIPIENLLYLRRLFYGGNWRFIILSIIRKIYFERIFGRQVSVYISVKFITSKKAPSPCHTSFKTERIKSIQLIF